VPTATWRCHFATIGGAVPQRFARSFARRGSNRGDAHGRSRDTRNLSAASAACSRDTRNLSAASARSCSKHVERGYGEGGSLLGASLGSCVPGEPTRPGPASSLVYPWPIRVMTGHGNMPSCHAIMTRWPRERVPAASLSESSIQPVAGHGSMTRIVPAASLSESSIQHQARLPLQKSPPVGHRPSSRRGGGRMRGVSRVASRDASSGVTDPRHGHARFNLVCV
jgi:hypothetical protein